MTAHAKYSPSKLDKISKCLGWESDPTPGPAAMRGTAFHGELAAYVNAVTTGADVPGISEIAQRGAAMFDDLCKRFPDLDWATEVKLDTGIPDCYGTADIVGVGDFSSTAVMLDWKSGTGKRDNAADSLQVAAYAIGLIRQHKHVDRVACIMAELEQEPTECTFTRNQLDEIARKIACLCAMADTATPADYKPSAEACRYCRHSGGACAAQNCDVATVSSKVPATKAGVLALVANMKPDDVADVLNKYKPQAEMVEAFIEAVEKRAKTMIESGQEVPGWRLNERNCARQWTVVDSRVVELCATYDVDPTEIASVATVEKRLEEKHGKKKAKEILGAISANKVSKTLAKEKE